jgi:hypothetical protein
MVSSGMAQIQSATNVPTPSDYVCVNQGPNSKVWQRTFVQTNELGDVMTNVQSYTELATGLSYLSNGVFVDSVEQVAAVAGGAQAIQGQHQVQWSFNGNNPGGAVTLTTPDGKTLSSTVYGLAWYDTGSGSNTVISRLQDCTGSIVAPNQVIYTNAFSNVTADVIYNYTKAGLSQDVALRTAPPAPDQYGLSDQSSVLQIYTQFFTAPQPGMTAVTNGNVVDEPVLDFGVMKMGVGQALFVNGQAAPAAVGNVSKQWVQINGGTFLIESIPYSAISNQLQQLPQASNTKMRCGPVRRVVESSPSRPPGSAKEGRPMKMARADTSQSRLVVDYVILSSTNNLTLQGDETYLVSGTVNVTYNLVIEGGAIVKYTNSGSPNITAGELVCETGPYRVGVLTSMNDDSAGSTISGSSGAPSRGGATYLIFSETADPVLRNLRFSYAGSGFYESISASEGNSIEVWDSQFINCGSAFSTYFSSSDYEVFPLYFYNVLFSQCTYGVNGVIFEGDLSVGSVNVTADQVDKFEAMTIIGAASVQCNATNSIFTAVTNMSGISFINCYTNASSSGIYQTVGAGSYYLAEGSTNRGWGTTNIPLSVLEDLQTLTTWPPTTNYINVTIATNLTLSPQAPRDTNGSTVDLGWHYCPLDHAVDIFATNATLTVQPGTALATLGFGLRHLSLRGGELGLRGNGDRPHLSGALQHGAGTIEHELGSSDVGGEFSRWRVRVGGFSLYGMVGFGRGGEPVFVLRGSSAGGLPGLPVLQWRGVWGLSNAGEHQLPLPTGQHDFE